MDDILIAKKMKCPVCGANVNCGSDRYAVITPSKEGPHQYKEYFWIQIFYCQKSDKHMFGVLSRDSKREAVEQ